MDVAAFSLHPPTKSCTNSLCPKQGHMLREVFPTDIVVYTQADGAQRSRHVRYYCRGMCMHMWCSTKGLVHLEPATLAITATTLFKMMSAPTILACHSSCKLLIIIMLKHPLLGYGGVRCIWGGEYWTAHSYTWTAVGLYLPSQGSRPPMLPICTTRA